MAQIILLNSRYNDAGSPWISGSKTTRAKQMMRNRIAIKVSCMDIIIQLKVKKLRRLEAGWIYIYKYTLFVMNVGVSK